jgi:hypothetical protein
MSLESDLLEGRMEYAMNQQLTLEESGTPACCLVKEVFEMLSPSAIASLAENILISQHDNFNSMQIVDFPQIVTLDTLFMEGMTYIGQLKDEIKMYGEYPESYSIFESDTTGFSVVYDVPGYKHLEPIKGEMIDVDPMSYATMSCSFIMILEMEIMFQ